MTTETLTPMQTELLKRSDAIMQSISGSISSAVEFSKDQIPDIALQYIAFQRVYSSTLILCVLLMVAFAVYLLRYASTTKWTKDLDTRIALNWIGGTIFGVLGMILFFANLKALLLVWFAPKVFLLQSLTSLIKG
jgi:hypothetical protein